MITKSFADILNPDKESTHNELISLNEMLSSKDIFDLYQKPTNTTESTHKKNTTDFEDMFMHDLIADVYKMVEYWQQFGFFDIRKDISNIVADISKKSMKCVSESTLPIEEEEDEQFECEEEPAA